MVFLMASQLVAFQILSATFPAPPSLWRTPLEAILIPLLPLARHKGHFRLSVFSRKWLYWPLTRARRLVLLVERKWHFQQVLHVNIDTGTSQRISNLPPIPPNHLRYVVISDTHLLHGDLHLPPGNVLLHCGDILVEDHGDTNSMHSKRCLSHFDDWLGKQQTGFETILVTGGNHDGILQVLDNNSTTIFRHGTFVNNKEVTMGNGPQSQRVYLSAGSRGDKHGANCAFQYNTDQAAQDHWSKVPSKEIDVLVTHGPPRGILDGTAGNAGCPILLQQVTERIQPRVHVFGHWHASPGVEKHALIMIMP